jgi:ABC-type uncharacterized transport system permease subunit
MFKPSFLGFIFNGIVLGIVIILFFMYFDKLNKNDIVISIILLSIAIGIHSMLHYREEKEIGLLISDK